MPTSRVTAAWKNKSAETLFRLVPRTHPKRAEITKAFSCAMRMQLELHGDTFETLIAKVDPTRTRTMCFAARRWLAGKALPFQACSYQLLQKIEHHYGLQDGYFESILLIPETPSQKALRLVNPSYKIPLLHHLPRNFDRRSEAEREEILGWIARNVFSSDSEFGKYQSLANKNPYSLRFKNAAIISRANYRLGSHIKVSEEEGVGGTYGVIDAPARLAEELSSLIAIKRAVLPPPDMRRYNRWTEATATLAVARFGQMFGALASAPLSPAMGRGVPLQHLTFALLVFPQVWDWYLHWRQRRRGFFTLTEQDTLYEIKGMSRDPTGWLRQRPDLAQRLVPIRGLITSGEISSVQQDWEKANDKLYRYANDRIPEMLRSKRVHRDPFDPIIVVLQARSPLGEYKKIADEIVRRMPSIRKGALWRAVAVRTYLMLRLTIHLGVRQRNLRELLLCPPGGKRRTAHELQSLQRGEMFWNVAAKRWEIYIPAIAFKNKTSLFFKGRPFQMVLPDLGQLYLWIDEYIQTHRPVLLGERPDPGAFLIKSSVLTSRSGEFDVCSFYEAWKAMIRKYGIYNPYTRRGAIKGLMAHGPHCVRDVLATHVLKKTGSYVLASYAIQDTVESTMRHYARFLPHEKSAKAADVLNEVWR